MAGNPGPPAPERRRPWEGYAPCADTNTRHPCRLAGVWLSFWLACESHEQAEAAGRAGFRAHDKPTVRLSALPQPAGGGRCRDHLLPVPGRAVQPERGPDQEG